jgi:hypothetical protein
MVFGNKTMQMPARSCLANGLLLVSEYRMLGFALLHRNADVAAHIQFDQATEIEVAQRGLPGKTYVDGSEQGS